MTGDRATRWGHKGGPTGRRATAWLVLALWAAAAAVLVPLAAKTKDVQSNDPVLALPGSAEVTRARASSPRSP